MSETEYGYGNAVEAHDGEFAGWRFWNHDPYENRSGPFFTRREDNGDFVCAFRAAEHHMNGAGFMHGGCLLTFADFALFAIATDALAGDNAVTMNLSGDFLGAVAAGALVEARGEVTRGGGKTIFVRGLVTADGEPALSFTGIIRRLTRRG
ncbi:PaaI family thioesterase [Erythrobacter sp. JK5]|uniref:PaaI family thioesterase n=1 Tax=Erythrobacter sp. JK5 TaxID=2829500 RepID=UPI001BAE07F8|nr:PaaI family thioesterase [Erythrobacter sp. JK5]QUL38872.1 PaaI family thioesterase [Erythrobacter sp. JK5]